jgi:antitoxin (DNA-binding transcriptional repressor) of toxin-antitoxin stability system
MHMREVTATQAARGFSAMLSAVEHEGETYVITRGGKVVARIEPAGGTSGKAVKALLRHYDRDPSWSDELAALRASTAAQEREWPD